MTIADESGETSDELTIVFSNADGKLELPSTGVELEPSIGFGTDLIPMGLFVVNKVTPAIDENSVSTITVTARSANMKASLKEHKDRQWENITIGSIVDTIASTHGMSSVVSPVYADVLLPNLSQLNKSDMTLLTDLARDVGAIAKPANGSLLFVEKGAGKSASGRALSPIAIDRADVRSASASIEERLDFKSVRARWRDKDAIEDRYAVVGGGNPVYSLRRLYRTEETAKNAATAKLKDMQRGKGKLSFTLSGSPMIGAETPLTFSGCGAGIDGEWVARSVRHQYDHSGYITNGSAELPGA